MEKEMQEYYKEIAETVNLMIPEEWEKFYFYAQVSDEGGGTYFYYNTPAKADEFKYSLEIPFKYNVGTNEFNDIDMKLFDLSVDLRNIFIKHNQEPWYSFTMSLESTGKFKIHYDYTNWFNTDFSFSDQMTIWKYKYLGKTPTDKSQKSTIDKYLEEYPNNPI